ncbi:hypothetical protein HDR58_00110, partial [bacterium]|nr:hypothetical protein [bacterium]
RWSHSVFGSNTSRGNYKRPAALNALDDEYSSTEDVDVPANGRKEVVYEDKAEAEAAGKDIGDLKSVTVWSENGRGKVVPASTDGLSYYYTSIDPSKNNFSLSALIHVKSWKFSNGQDGFGMMVTDTVGQDGDDGNSWTNSYQLLASKIQYSWVRATGVGTENYVPGYVTNAPGNGTTIMRYEMKLGVGWNAKEGAKASDVAKIKSGALTSPVNFSTSSGTLEHSAGDYNNGVGQITGSYNAVGNAYSTAPESSFGNDAALLKDFRFQIQKYDNAYALRYLAVEATENIPEGDEDQYWTIDGKNYKILGEQVFSDDNNNKLTQIDKNNIYVGFFAARNARIGVNDIKLDVTEAGSDPYVIPEVSVDPSVTISSMEASNSSNYDLMVNTNFDGTMTVYSQPVSVGEDGKEVLGTKKTVITGKAITAGTKYTFTSALGEGTTRFTCSAKPNENYVPGDNQVLSSKELQTAEIDVTYHAFADDTIYVKPEGAQVGTTKNEGDNVYIAGSKEYPTNVYDAVNYAKVGQTIILANAKYDLVKEYNHNENGAANLLVGKKHDGTARSYITMRAATLADEWADGYRANQRPVLDFGQKTQNNDTAFSIAGNYWHFEGFDVMGSKDGEKGILLGGSHNILSDLRTYLNGNTGLQVARYSNGTRADWPSYNTIINCSSFMNYDSGYEDADGFAAKLTCGDGNKFIGCIAAYNADDGWDLFAKVESGSIGVVTLENCLAFRNGYLFGAAGVGPGGSDLIYRYTDFSQFTKTTSIVSAGNGNGFKMGGDSMSGYHVLRNSVAFGNKSKGIDSNSCPDIQIYNSISFNNEANNVALYTGAAVNTDYYVENLISIKDSSCGNGGASTAENISLKGTQNKNKIYGANNYFWNGSKSANVDGLEFNTSKFVHMSMNNAIFGSTGTRIDRDADGSINLHGFLEFRDGEGFGDGIEMGVGGSNPGDVLDKGSDIYVFASDYSKGNSKLSEITNLKQYDSTLEGYNWVDGDILISSFAGTAVDFKVTNGTRERTVTVNFIQLDGAELQIVSGDGNETRGRSADGILDSDETWIVEAVPVISPAVKPDKELKGGSFSAEIKDTPKNMLVLGTPTTGTVNENLKVDKARVTVNGEDGKNGSAKLTATVTLKVGSRTVKKTAVLAFTVKDKVGIKFDTITPDPATNSDKVQWTSDHDYIQVDMDTMKDQTFTMKNLHFEDLEGNIQDFGKGVTVKVNDTSVIKLDGKIQPTADGKGVDVSFKVVNKSGDGGTATVTVTSKNDKSLVRNYIVTVSGSKFAWNSGTVTIDKAQTAGIQLAALEPFGTSGTVNKITVKEVYKGTKAAGKTYSDYNKFFEAKQVTEGVYELNTTAAAVGTGEGTKAGKGPGTLPKGTYTVVYQAEVNVPDAGQTEAPQTDEAAVTTKPVQFTPITIKVTETRPTVTFRQTKRVNLFYKNGTDGSTGKLTASSKQGAVTKLEVTNGRNSNVNEYFRFSNNGSGYDIVSISKDKVNVKPNGTADYRDIMRNNKAVLRAYVDGYYPNYYVERNFTVGLEFRQPRLKVTALDKTIYTAVGMDGADILIYDPDSEMYLSPDVATIELLTEKSAGKAYSKANADFEVGDIANSANSGNGVRLIAKVGAKGGAVRISIKYDDWHKDASVIVNQSIRVVKTVPRMTIRPVKLNINTEKFVGKEQASAPILVTGASGYTISDLKLTGANAKATEFLKFVDYELSTDVNGNQVLLVNLKAVADDGVKFPSKVVNERTGAYGMERGYSSSYSFKAEYMLGGVKQNTNFKISLVKNEKLTVAVKGNINIIDRENGTVNLKPRMTNFTPSQVSNVELTGDAANLFTVVDFDRSTGTTTVKAKDTAVLKNGSYKVTPVYYFDLGVSGTADMTTDRPIVIRAAQPNLKITGLKDVLEVKLSSPDTAAQRTLTVAPAGAYITGLTQTSGLENFTLTYTGDGVEVTINNRAGLKEGKTYKITALINVEGSGSNVKKQQISIPVKVIR